MNNESQSNTMFDFIKNKKLNEISGSFLFNSYQYLIIDNDCITEYPNHLKVGNLDIEGRSYYIVKTRKSTKIDQLNLANLLTERELQVTTLAALGRSNKQIAHHLKISDCTVSAHLRRIFIKLNVENRAAMVYRCAVLIDQLQHLDDRFSQSNCYIEAI